MAYASANPYRDFGLTAIQAPADARAGFIRQTYAHLLGAVLAFVGIEAALFSTGAAQRLTELMTGNGQGGMLIVLFGFMGISWLANSWAQSSTSVSTQYLGLGLYVLAQAVIMAPLLYFANTFSPPGSHLIATAGIVTGILFLGLTAVVLMTGADFSWMRTGLAAAGFAAIGVILCGWLFGFSLGLWFTGAMILFACAYILYDTSNVLHHYRIGQHVAASLALFASVALLFFYVLRLLMSLSSRD
jgi:FtsH-binding integral membrane protein